MDILQEVKKYYGYAVAMRRELHENPELTGLEVKTLERIGRELDAMEIPYTKVPDGGIIGTIQGGRSGKTVLLRADIDALPLEETPCNLRREKVCVSKNPGVCHGCGHDAHTAMLLAEAKILKAHAAELSGDVILCFEQGEECGGQVRNLLKYVLEEAEIPVDTCFATHVKSDVPAGKISVEPGPVISGGYGFEIRLRGTAGHGSRPDMAHSVLDCFHGIYSAMNMLRLKYVSPYDVLTFSVGTINAGTKANIIPDELTFAGSIRTFSVDGGGRAFMDEFLRVLDHETALHHCTWEAVRLPNPIYEVDNNETCSEIAKAAVKKILGEGTLMKAEPWMACESFSMYTKLWPGVITFTGIQNEELGSGANHHTPEFDIDESGMLAGVAAAVGYVFEFLDYEGEIPFEPYGGTLAQLVNRNL